MNILLISALLVLLPVVVIGQTEVYINKTQICSFQWYLYLKTANILSLNTWLDDWKQTSERWSWIIQAKRKKTWWRWQMDTCGVEVHIFWFSWKFLLLELCCSVTNTVTAISLTPTQFPVGYYKLILRTGKYYEAKKVSTFYPYLAIVFERSTPDNILVVISMSPYGYFFYKGDTKPL